MVEVVLPLDNGRDEDSQPPANSSIGLLLRLPLELIHGILLDELNLGELTNLKSVSHDIRSMIDSLPQYAALVRHAPNVIQTAGAPSMLPLQDITRMYNRKAEYTRVQLIDSSIARVMGVLVHGGSIARMEE
ncbi:hypothetical protein B0J14DRAFT_667139 [Halenospora varia]|nr:hypothetical protein B0J14DRAFT_667139 [Halenospora varia]